MEFKHCQNYYKPKLNYSWLCFSDRVVHVRETRVTGIISHVMIGLSMLMLPYPLAYIPRPVLDGLFIYVAITALYGNQLFDRILLFFTEQVRHLNGCNYDHYTCK